MRLSAHASSILSLILFVPAGVFAQQVRTGTIAKTYTDLCANCHGANLEGAQAPSMLDNIWSYGGDDESLSRSIRNGYPEKGMPAWSAALPDKEIRAMVIYIREKRAEYERGQTNFTKPADSISSDSELQRYRLDTWIEGLTDPWSLAFLAGGRALVTEKRGNLFVIENGRLAGKPVSGVPTVDTAGQAGLYDIVPHPHHARNGWLYLAYSDLRKDSSGGAVSLTRIVRGRLKEGAWGDQETIFEAPIEHYLKAGGVHFGGRMAFGRDGMLYFTIGERGSRDHAQELGRPNGKVHRVHDDGRIPKDNPFVKDKSANPTIWSFGHRNPQGLAFHPTTGELFDAEHGPRGGDEINLVRKGLNYGWPIITYGMEYNGAAMTDITAREGLEQPVTYWTPSIAVCGINFYSGELFPKWKGHLFVASLAAQELRRLEIVDGKLLHQEVLFKNLGRIRHVIMGPDGALYVLLPTRIARMTAGDTPSAAQ